MDDVDDIFLYLFPHKGEGFDGAAFTTAMPQNKSRFLAARRCDTLERGAVPRRHERGGTELPVERGLLENTDCLAVRFSHGAKTRVGVVGGRALNADLAFQDTPGISNFHLAFTFDDQYRPIVRDLGSTGGTKITYNGEEGERRSNFDWLLQGPGIARGRAPVLNITDLVQFQVIVPPRYITTPDYINKIKRFRLGTTDPADLFASFILLNQPCTGLPTGHQTPLTGSRPILYRKTLGAGAFGVAKYVWNVTSGDEYVVKRPLQKLINSGKIDEESWRNEANIMRGLAHDHIVAFRDAAFSPYPQLTFEWVPGGSLDTYSNLSTFESTQVLCQLSSALEYLHNQQPSVGHRDIKPANILVVERGVDGIYVKFADFGLSKAADILKTFCGSLEWAAPEIYLKAADRKATANDTYSVAVDVWSLGVVVAWLECGGLPEYEAAWATDATAWIHAVQAHVINHYKQQGSELLWLLLDNMLVEEPDERSSADFCHDEALKLLQHIQDTWRQDSTPSCIELGTDDDDDSTIPGPSIPGGQSALESESAEQASTFRLGVQANSEDGSEAPIRKPVEDMDGKPVANRNIISPTESEEGRERSGAPDYGTQPNQVPKTSADPQQNSMRCSHDEAKEGAVDEASTGGSPQEPDDISSLVRCHFDRKVQTDRAQESVETSKVEAERPRRSRRKRILPADRSPSSPLSGSFTQLLEGTAAQRRTFRRDDSSSKGPPVRPNHKRSKEG